MGDSGGGGTGCGVRRWDGLRFRMTLQACRECSFGMGCAKVEGMHAVCFEREHVQAHLMAPADAKPVHGLLLLRTHSLPAAYMFPGLAVWPEPAVCVLCTRIISVQLNDSRGKGVVGTSRFRAVTGSPTNYAGTTDDDGRDDYPSSPDPRHHALASAPSLSDVSAMGADIFELIADAMAQERVRLVEVFREMDRDGSGSLNTEQLNRLVKRFVPDAQPTHLRYLQLILDADGNARISYKELATAMKAANRGGVRLLLRDHIEVHMLLQRVAILMLLEVGVWVPAVWQQLPGSGARKL